MIGIYKRNSKKHTAETYLASRDFYTMYVEDGIAEIKMIDGRVLKYDLKKYRLVIS